MTGEYSRANKLKIEIVDTAPINGGIRVHARAFRRGRQLGFGKDGSVDIETFNIYNSPILVDSPNGEIVREWEDEMPDGTKTRKTRRLREDPKEALIQVIEHNLTVMKNIHDDKKIERGKVGQTTSTFYSGAGDGRCTGTPNATWATVHDASSGDTANYTSASLGVYSGKDGSAKYDFARVFLPFDTSALPDTDSISTAVMSAYAVSKTDGDNDAEGYITLVQTTQASNTSLVLGDFDQCGSISNPTEGIATGERKDITGISTSAYLDFTLDATGIGWINNTGVTKLGVREGHDTTNTVYAGANGTYNFVSFYMSEQAGTTQDPKLVVEHAAAATGHIYLPLLGVG